MGYTHYYTFIKKHGEAAKVERRYRRAVLACQRAVKLYQTKVKDTEARLSGYTAHTPVGQYGGVKLNGTGDMAHEDFYLREHFKENELQQFCKTERKPYDTIVVACLFILQYHLKDYFSFSSDGTSKDLLPGKKLASKVLGRKI